MYQEVEEVLEKLRPYLMRDGGDVELLGIDDGVVRVRLLGACENCPSSTLTLKAGIEQALIGSVPGVRQLEQVF
jgi:Fe-S cluster biogenesis protein NfuA